MTWQVQCISSCCPLDEPLPASHEVSNMTSLGQSVGAQRLSLHRQVQDCVGGCVDLQQSHPRATQQGASKLQDPSSCTPCITLRDMLCVVLHCPHSRTPKLCMPEGPMPFCFVMQAAAADESRRPPFNALMRSPAAKCNMMSCPACLRYDIGSKTACFKARPTWGWKLAADTCHVKSDKPTV